MIDGFVGSGFDFTVSSIQVRSPIEGSAGFGLITLKPVALPRDGDPGVAVGDIDSAVRDAHLSRRTGGCEFSTRTRPPFVAFRSACPLNRPTYRRNGLVTTFGMGR